MIKLVLYYIIILIFMDERKNFCYLNGEWLKACFNKDANISEELEKFLSDRELNSPELQALHYILYYNKEAEILKSSDNLASLALELKKVPVISDKYEIKSRINNILKLSDKSEKEDIKSFFEKLYELNPFVKDFIWEENYEKLVENLNRNEGNSMESDFINIKNIEDYNRFINRYSRILAWKDENNRRYKEIENFKLNDDLKSKLISILKKSIDEYYKWVNENDWSADKYWQELWYERSSKWDQNAWCAAFVNWLLMKEWLAYIENYSQLVRAKWFLWPEFRWSWHVWIKSWDNALLSWNAWDKVNNNVVYSSEINRIPIWYVIPWDINTKYINSNYKNIPKSIKNKINYKIINFNYSDIPNWAIVVFDSYKWTR